MLLADFDLGLSKLQFGFKQCIYLLLMYVFGHFFYHPTLYNGIDVIKCVETSIWTITAPWRDYKAFTITEIVR